MLIKTIPGWSLLERKATPENVFWNRREFSKRAATGTILGATGIGLRGGVLRTPLQIFFQRLEINVMYWIVR